MRRFLGARTGNTPKPLSCFDALEAQVEQAEKQLSLGASPFHKLGVGVTFFLRATLGFEKDVIEVAKAKLNEAEQAAQEYRRSALKDPSNAVRSEIFPTGSEYALCQAEAQLMSAVLAVLNESLTESLRGFYNLRKAFKTLYEISEAERNFMESHRRGRLPPGDASTEYRMQSSGKESTAATKSATAEPAESFEGAEEHLTEQSASNSDQDQIAYHKESAKEEDHATTPEHSVTPKPQKAAAEDRIEAFTSNPADLFVHAGMNLCYGLLQLMVSMIPPAFSRVSDLFSFKGDRHEGLRRLWIATKYREDINGAMAALVILGYHNIILDACDILPADTMPRIRLRSLLYDMRRLYPDSKLWMMEEARMLGGERQLERAVGILRGGKPSSLRQINAMTKFDIALNMLYLHEYQQCADAFMACIEPNDWSHALYYYIAGACHVELYRMHRDSDPGKAEEHARQAAKHLREAPSHMGKKRMTGRQLPINVFVSRKISKWDARAAARSCRLVEAVGVSPVVEMTYFWSGFRKMGREQLSRCLERLEWSSNLDMNPVWTEEAIDEKCIRSFLKAVCQRFSGEIKAAKSTLTDEIIVHSLQALKACEHADTWTLPIAHYELAVCYWRDAGEGGPQDDSLKDCENELSMIENWETFELEARVGMKVATARQSLRQKGLG